MLPGWKKSGYWNSVNSSAWLLHEGCGQEERRYKRVTAFCLLSRAMSWAVISGRMGHRLQLQQGGGVLQDESLTRMHKLGRGGRDGR